MKYIYSILWKESKYKKVVAKTISVYVTNMEKNATNMLKHSTGYLKAKLVQIFFYYW